MDMKIIDVLAHLKGFHANFLGRATAQCEHKGSLPFYENFSQFCNTVLLQFLSGKLFEYK